MRKTFKNIAFILWVFVFMLCGCKSGSDINSQLLSSYSKEESISLAVEEKTENNSSDFVSQESVNSEVEVNNSEVEVNNPEESTPTPENSGVNINTTGESGNQNFNYQIPNKQTEGEKVKLKYIALTFDDGPNTDNTDLLLDKLSSYNIPATFMLKGSNINEQTASVIKRIASMNHEIGNHSFEHTTSLYTSGEEYILDDYNKTEDLIKKYANVSSAFYRPPFILVNDVLRNTIPVPLISGTGCNDWEDSVSSAERAETIISKISEGGIILLHDTSGNTKTVEALDTIIPTLQNKGYTFVTVTDLFEKCNITASKGVLYKGAYQAQ